MSWTTTCLTLGRGVFSVHCYLVRTDAGFALVDTGMRRQRAKLAGMLRARVLENRKSPRLGSIMDDLPTPEAGVDRTKSLNIGTVYPGHGAPFRFAELMAAHG